MAFQVGAADLTKEGKMDEALHRLSADNNPVGVLEFLHWDHPWNNYKYPGPEAVERAVKMMREAGVGFVRVDFLWDDIEPQPGVFNFEKYDRIVEITARHGIKVLGILDYVAAWASPDGKWNAAPDTQLFVNYAAKVISRYKDKVKHWEVWNEPDSSVYWEPQDGMKRYCVFLKEVYIAAKAIDPQCVVLNGGLAHGLSSVNRLYDNGAAKYFDIMNVHYFASPLHKGTLKGVERFPQLVYKIMCRNGDAAKKIWVTETGCPGVKRGLKVNYWWLGKNPDEATQAKWVEGVYSALLKSPNVEKVFWAFFRDTSGHWNNGVDYFGLVRWDFSPKPAYAAFKNLSACLKKD
jgi:hypothetical protein